MSRETRIEAQRLAKDAGAAERMAKHDQHFASDYLRDANGKPISIALAKSLGIYRKLTEDVLR
jgi:hypothetical protein